jgi:hypothetical protein
MPMTAGPLENAPRTREPADKDGKSKLLLERSVALHKPLMNLTHRSHPFRTSMSWFEPAGPLQIPFARVRQYPNPPTPCSKPSASSTRGSRWRLDFTRHWTVFSDWVFIDHELRVFSR